MDLLAPVADDTSVETRIGVPRHVQGVAAVFDEARDKLWTAAATSSLNGNVWDGALHLYESNSSGGQLGQTRLRSVVGFECGVSDVTWMGVDQLAWGCDDGSVHWASRRMVASAGEGDGDGDNAAPGDGDGDEDDADDDDVSTMIVHSKSVARVAYSRAAGGNGGHLLTAGLDGLACVIDVETSEHIHSFDSNAGLSDTAWHTTNPALFATSSAQQGGHLLLWDTRLGTDCLRLADVRDDCLSVTFLPSVCDPGNTLLAGTEDGALRLYDLRKTAAELDTLATSSGPDGQMAPPPPAGPPPPPPPADTVGSISMSQGIQRLASVSGPRGVVVVCAATSQGKVHVCTAPHTNAHGLLLRETLNMHSDVVAGITLASPSEAARNSNAGDVYAVTGSWDRTLVFHQIRSYDGSRVAATS